MRGARRGRNELADLLVEGHQAHRVALPQDLGPYGAPACRLFVGREFAYVLFGWNGVAERAVGIPSDSGLVGARFFLQALVADAANPLGLCVSNAYEGRIGPAR